MRRKLRAEKGVTLVEMLACAVILVLLGLMLNTGIQVAARSYHAITAKAETQLLLSTITDALADDLRYARDIVTEEAEADSEAGGKKLISYNSDSYGLAACPGISGEGQILVGGKKLLPAGAYGNGAYEAETLDIFYDGACFSIYVRVKEKNGSISAETKVSVRCLNGKT